MQALRMERLTRMLSGAPVVEGLSHVARMACVDGEVSISDRDFDGEAIEPEVMHVDWDTATTSVDGVTIGLR